MAGELNGGGGGSALPPTFSGFGGSPKGRGRSVFVFFCYSAGRSVLGLATFVRCGEW